jgi:hypothetical protein
VIWTIVTSVVTWTNDLTLHVTHAVFAHAVIVWTNYVTWAYIAWTAAYWTIDTWTWLAWSTWTHTWYIYPTHSSEYGATAVVVESARRCIEEMVHATIVQIDAEAPAMVVECDWTIEVIVCHQKCPLAFCEKTTECIVACINYFHVVIVTITKGHCVEIVVYTTDIIVVDVIQIINESCTES